jgi:hypothetical protein
MKKVISSINHFFMIWNGFGTDRNKKYSVECWGNRLFAIVMLFSISRKNKMNYLVVSIRDSDKKIFVKIDWIYLENPRKKKKNSIFAHLL